MTTLSTGMAVSSASVHTHESFVCAVCAAEAERPAPIMRAAPPGRPFDLVECRSCGVVQQFPRYNAAELAGLYGPQYYVFAESESHRWARAVQQYVVHLAHQEDRPGRRLLDLGCAMGHLAVLARERGWRVTGLDISAEAVSEAARRFGLDVRAGTLASHLQTLHRFDVILMGDVLEHVPAPAALVRHVHHALVPGGVLCIDTPNWGSRWRRWGRGRWLGLNRYHINFFTASSLTGLLERGGFCGCQAGSYTHYRYGSWSSRPEIQGVVNHLPTFLAWRLNRLLGRLPGRSPWRCLMQGPPTGLREAAAMVNSLVGQVPGASESDLKADNLTIIAHRK